VTRAWWGITSPRGRACRKSAGDSAPGRRGPPASLVADRWGPGLPREDIAAMV
jgi:hypothetical protein